MFSTLHKTKFKFSVTFILSSAHAFNLDRSKILSFGKEFIPCIPGIIYILDKYNWKALANEMRVKVWIYAKAFNQTTHSFNDLEEEGFFKTSWEKEEILVTIFSLFPIMFFLPGHC